MAPVRGPATVVPPVSAVQVVLCAARPAVPLIRRMVAAAVVVPTRMVAVTITSFFILLLGMLGNILPRGLFPLVFSCAGFLGGGVVAVRFGMGLLASAIRAAGRLLLAPGCLLVFWWVA